MTKAEEMSRDELLGYIAKLEEDVKLAGSLLERYEAKVTSEVGKSNALREKVKALMEELESCEDTSADMKKKHDDELAKKDQLINQLYSQIAKKEAMIEKQAENVAEKQVALLSVSNDAEALIARWTDEYGKLREQNYQLRIACGGLREQCLQMNNSALMAMCEISNDNNRVMMAMMNKAHHEMSAAKDKFFAVVLALSQNHSADMREGMKTVTGLVDRFLDNSAEDRRQMELNNRQIIDSHKDLSAKALIATGNLGAVALNHMGEAHQRAAHTQDALIDQGRGIVTSMTNMTKELGYQHVQGLEKVQGHTTITKTHQSSVSQANCGNSSQDNSSRTENTGCGNSANFSLC